MELVCNLISEYFENQQVKSNLVSEVTRDDQAYFSRYPSVDSLLDFITAMEAANDYMNYYFDDTVIFIDSLIATYKVLLPTELVNLSAKIV